MRPGTLIALLAAALLAGCGGHDDHPGEPAAPATGNSADAGFVREMIPHHEGAIEMAELALDQAEHPELEALARDIIEVQDREIAELEAVADELGIEAGHPAGDGGHMGRENDAMGDPGALDGARPFDRAFIDMMIPHHEGAIEMSETLLAEGSHPRLQELARAIIDGQRREIDQLRAWRADWY